MKTKSVKLTQQEWDLILTAVNAHLETASTDEGNWEFYEGDSLNKIYVKLLASLK